MRTILAPFRKAAELNLGGTSTSEKVFQDADANPVVLGLGQNYLGPNTSTGRQCLRLVVFAGGRVTGGTTTNFTAQLQWGSSATPGSNTDLESAAAVAVNSNSGLWDILAHLIIVVTGTGTARIDGYCQPLIAGSTRTLTAVAVTDNSITTYDPTLLTSTVGLLVTGTFSAGNAGNIAWLDYFRAEVIE